MFGWFKRSPAPVVETLPTIEWLEAEIEEVRKANIISRDTGAFCQAEEDVDAELMMRGITLSDADRTFLVKHRAQQLIDESNAIWDAEDAGLDQAFREFDESYVASQRHAELIDTIERGNIAAKIVDFTQRHPILAGFIGTDIYHRVKNDE